MNNILLIMSCIIAMIFAGTATSHTKEKSVHDFSLTDINGKKVELSEYKGKVLLIVNVASFCGYTKHYTGLQSLYQKHGSKGFEVLGVPCNQFGNQEPGTEKEIKEFCESNYNITFPLFSKIDVNGENANPLYVYLKSETPGVAGPEDIKWNFTKFLIDKDGRVVKRYGHKTPPEDIETDILNLMN